MAAAENRFEAIFTGSGMGALAGAAQGIRQIFKEAKEHSASLR